MSSCGNPTGDGQRRSYAPRTRGNRKLVFRRTPLDVGRRSVDTEDDERGLPDALLVQSPDVRVPVLGTGDDPVGLGSPVDGRDELVVLEEGISRCISRSIAFWRMKRPDGGGKGKDAPQRG